MKGELLPAIAAARPSNSRYATTFFAILSLFFGFLYLSEVAVNFREHSCLEHGPGFGNDGPHHRPAPWELQHPPHEHDGHSPFRGRPHHHDNYHEGMPRPPPSFFGDPCHRRAHRNPHHTFEGPHAHNHHEGHPPHPPRPFWKFWGGPEADERHHRHCMPPPLHFRTFDQEYLEAEHRHAHEEKSKHNALTFTDVNVDDTSFQCPHGIQLLGQKMDNAHWVCGFEQIAAKEDCVVYSFGIRGKSSFEGSILKESTGCTVFGFDTKVKSFGTDVPQSERVELLPMVAAYEFPIRSAMMHKFVDILKIELNNDADVVAVIELLQSFTDTEGKANLRPYPPSRHTDMKPSHLHLPIGQILLVVRTESMHLDRLLHRMPEMGMMPFHAGASESGDSINYSFVNVDAFETRGHEVNH